MNDIIERMARAIAYTQMMRQYVDLEHLNDIGCVIEIDRVWPQFVPEAIAAFDMVRELTPNMLAADNVEFVNFRVDNKLERKDRDP